MLPQSHETQPLTVLTLGDCRVTRVSDRVVAVEGFGRGKPQALISYLACLPKRSATRDELAGLLWGDVDRESGRHALRQTVWYIKKRFGDDVLAGDTQSLWIACALTCDRDAFLSAVEAGDCVGAVTAYTGPFLPDLAIPGGAEFEHWVELERARLRSSFLRCVDVVTRDHLAAGRVRDALALARRGVDADPFDQRTRRLLLEVHITAHDRLAATTEADRIEQFFAAEDIGLEPATRSALGSARAQNAAAPTAEPDERPLVRDLIGREREFARLLDRWSGARAGRFAQVHVVADAGLGKSALLQHFSGRLLSKRGRVAHVRANPGERRVPYAAAADLALVLSGLPGAAAISASAAAALVALHPALSSTFTGATADTAAGSEALRRRAYAIAELARAVSDDAPLALLVDDLHWADPDSKQLLATAFARLDAARILVVTTARPGEAVILAREPAETIRLDALTEHHVAELIERVARLPHDPWAAGLPAAIHRATGGSPLNIIETLQGAVEAEVLSIEDGTWTCRDSRRLDEYVAAGYAVERRLRALSPRASEVLRLLAVAGTPVRCAAIADSIDADTGAVESLLTTLERRGFVSGTADSCAVAHDEIADRVLRLTTSEERRAAHRKLADHFSNPADFNAPLAIEHFLAAGDEASVRDLMIARLRTARRAGDWRPTGEVCREILGAAQPAITERLSGQVPLRLRRRGRFMLGAASVAVLALAALGTAVAVRRPSDADAWLLVGTIDGAKSMLARIPVNDRLLRERTPLEVRMRPLSGAAIRDTLRLRYEAVTMPDGAIAYSRITADSGGEDVFLHHPDGTTARLTNVPGDDSPMDRSPDGRFLLIGTQRWSKAMHRDLAILDVATGKLRALTTTDAAESDGTWSPDGSRIAFVRVHFERRPVELCVIAFDGTGERCVSRPDADGLAPMRWRDVGTLAVLVRDVAERVNLVDASAFTFTPIGNAVSVKATAVDGSMFVGFAAGRASRRPELMIRSVAEPERQRPLLAVSASEGLRVKFERSPAGAPYLDRVRIVVPEGGTPVDVPIRLSAVAVQSSGAPGDVPPIRWMSLDTSVAHVTETGILRPRREGAFTVIASAGGWRADTASIRIVGPQAAPARTPAGGEFGETWATFDTLRWAPYGVPRPFLARHASGVAALDVNGDSTYPSGTYSRQSFPADRGISVRVRLSVQLTALQWQIAALYLTPIDSSAMRRWDHVTGNPPRFEVPRACIVNVPAGEGYPGVTRLRATFGSEVWIGALTPAQQRGVWIDVDLQLFPDGRCGVALAGRAQWISSVAVPTDMPMALMLEGKSVRGRALIGPLEVWIGVRPGIDWLPLLEQSASGRGAPDPNP